MNPADYQTITEAAASLGVTQGAIRQAIDAGRLPYAVVFGRKLIRRADVETYRARTQPYGEKLRGRPNKRKP